MKIQIAAILFPAVLLIGCPHPLQDPEVPPPNPPVDTDWCKAMCDNIGPKGLSCDEGKPVYNSDKPGPKDVPNQSCEEWCVELQDKGFFINPRCMSVVPTCDDIEDWRLKEPETCSPDSQ